MKHRCRAIIIKDEKVLLMFRNNDGRVYFTIPGGKLEKGESPEQAALREVYEETSIRCEIVAKLITVIGDEETKHTLFVAEYLEGEPKLQSDSVEYKAMHDKGKNLYMPCWVNIDEIKEVHIAPKELEHPFKDYIKQL